MSWFIETTPNWTILLVSIFGVLIGFAYGYLIGRKVEEKEK